MTSRLPEELNKILEKFRYLKPTVSTLYEELDSKNSSQKEDLINEEIKCILNKKNRVLKDNISETHDKSIAG